MIGSSIDHGRAVETNPHAIKMSDLENGMMLGQQMHATLKLKATHIASAQSNMDVQSKAVDFELDAFSEFLAKYPAYKDTMIIDSLRREEYPHLDEKGQACLDYTGVGLFSGSQIGRVGIERSYTTSNLATHAMYTEEGSTECYFRKRVLHYLNLDEEDYYIVFTANAFSAFKLLGTSYPFHDAPNLLLGYDHKCENVDALSKCCLGKLACVQSVALSWPWCRIDAHDLRKKLCCKRKMGMQKGGGAHKGLFAFPYSSRVTGCRSSSTWIPQAQQNGWHVLLDVTSIDAKILDSLGLSLFLPDFVICSFYNVFGEDPTGLGCLAVKKSVLRTLGDSSRARAIGMVTIMSKGPSPLIASESCNDKNKDTSSTHVSNLTGIANLQDLQQVSRHQPEWSADLMAIDNAWFYQSNNDNVNWPEGARHEVGEGVFFHQSNGDHMNVLHVAPHHLDGAIGKGDVHADLSLRHSCDYGKGVLDKDMLNHNGGIEQRESENAIVSQVGSKSFSMWMANQAGSFRSISARERDGSYFNFASISHKHVGIGPMHRSGESEIEELGPLFTYNSKSTHVNQQSPRQVQTELLQGTIPPTSHMSLRRLFKYETKAKIREHLQRAGQVNSDEALTVHDWLTYYAEKARFLSSASSSASSSSRFAFEGVHDREAPHEKATMQTEIACKGLDHADLLGYKRIAVRLRLLADWLISSLLQLRHPPPRCSKLVRFCSRMSLAERASSTVAFSLADSCGNAFDVKRVQLLADRSNISIRIGVLEGMLTKELPERDQHHEEPLFGCMELSSYKCLSKDDTLQRLEMPVLYVSLGFLNNFSDVYRLWCFVCRFLDPQFVDQELWHYQALNQETIEI